MKISKSAIFLFELMFVILIFAISAAVCSSIFAEAYGVSTRSEELTMAVVKAESAAEEFKAGEGETAKALEAGNGGHVVRFYDQDWNPINEEGKAMYALVLRPGASELNGVRTCDIAVKKVPATGATKEIFRLQAKRFDG
jgi:Tfp pilus assembly protein PilE